MRSRNIAALTSSICLVACASYTQAPAAIANLQATKGNTAIGTVQFSTSGGKIRVVGEVQGLKPGAVHGFHIHEKGDCSSGDGVSAGGHFNPTTKSHGSHDQSEHHAGDMPSLLADASGTAKFSFETDSITVGSGATDVIGRGLIVHRDPDDFKTQPTGNSGPRVACAVITKA